MAETRSILLEEEPAEDAAVVVRARGAVQWNVGALMLVMVPIAVCLAAWRAHWGMGLAAVYLTLLATIRSGRLLAERKQEVGATTNGDLVRAFLNSLWLMTLLTVAGVLSFLVPVAAGAAVGALVAAVGFSGAWWPSVISVWVLGAAGFGPVLSYRVLSQILSRFRDPWGRVSGMPAADE